MPFYTTPISKLTEADLLELLGDNAVENLRLEFKSEVPKEDQTVKKLSSFANTYGGIIVIGAEEKDGRITKLSGVPLEPGYKQTIANWCFMKFTPPLTAEVSEPIKLANGQYCYVISVPESDVAPHFVNGRRGVWIRTDEFSNRFRAELANENELRALFDRRRAVRERRDFNIRRAQERFDAHVANEHTDKGGHLGDVGPILELCVTPRFPARPLCPHGDLQGASQPRQIQLERCRVPRLWQSAGDRIRKRNHSGQARRGWYIYVFRGCLGDMLLRNSDNGRRAKRGWGEHDRHSPLYGERFRRSFSSARSQNA